MRCIKLQAFFLCLVLIQLLFFSMLYSPLEKESNSYHQELEINNCKNISKQFNPDYTRSPRDTWVDNFEHDALIETMTNVELMDASVELSKTDFTIFSTAVFDNGTKINVETYTDWANDISNTGGVPLGELHLKYGDVYSENFEGTDEQILDNYDSNWDMAEGKDSDAKIDTDVKYSGDSCLRISETYPNQPLTKRTVTSFTDEELIGYLRYTATDSANGATGHIVTRKNDQPLAGVVMYQKVWSYIDGPGRVDTSNSVSQNTWYKIKIKQNFATDKYDAWIDGGSYTNFQLVNNADLGTTGQGSANTLYLRGGTGWLTGNVGTLWYDNIKIGDYYQTGSWESEPIELLNKYSLSETSIDFSDVIPNKSEIDCIEWLEGGVVKATYETDIQEPGDSPKTITENDLTSGKFNDIINNFTIKVYLKSDGGHTPVVNKISGKLRCFNGHIISKPIALNQNYRWDKISVSKTIPIDTEIKVSVLDATTDKYIKGFENSTFTSINLSTIDSKLYPEIKLRADLFGNSVSCPKLNSWSLSWLEDYPVLEPEIPSTYTLPEDSVAVHLINLSEYFHDYYDTIDNLTFTLKSQSDKKHLEAKIDGYYLDFFTKLANWTGSESFKVECMDTGGLKTESNSFDVTVTPVNDPPVWSKNLPNLKLDEDSSKNNWLDLDSYVNDLEDDYLEFSVVNHSDPNNISINIDAENQVTVVPSKDYFGTVMVTIQVYEGNNKELYANDSFEIQVLGVPDPPIITPKILDQIVNEDSWLNITILAKDIDHDENLNFYSNITRENFQIDPASGNLTFHPTNDDVGILFVNISVVDSDSLKGYDEFTITVNNMNDPPDDPMILLPTSEAKFKTNEQIEFIGEICQDIDMVDIINYSWDFDFTDGIQKNKVGRVVNKTYDVPGRYKVTLTITDGTVEKSTFIFVNITKPETVTPEPTEILETSSESYFWLIILVVCIIVILLITVGVLMIYRKRKKSLLNKYLEEIDQAYDWARTNPTIGKEKLSSLKMRLTNELKDGRLAREDYYILENQLNDYMRLLGMTIAGSAPGKIPTALPFQGSTQYEADTSSREPGSDKIQSGIQTPVTPATQAQVQPSFVPVKPTPAPTPVPQPQTQKPQTQPPVQAQGTEPKKKLVKCFNCGNYVTVTLAPEGEPTLVKCQNCGNEGTI